MGAHTLGILLSPGVWGVVPSILQLPGGRELYPGDSRETITLGL